eukprot:g1181.t1
MVGSNNNPNVPLLTNDDNDTLPTPAPSPSKEAFRRPMSPTLERAVTFVRTGSDVVFGTAGSLRPSMLSLAASAMGISVLALPFAFSVCGLFNSIIFLFFCSFANSICGYFLCCCYEIVRGRTNEMGRYSPTTRRSFYRVDSISGTDEPTLSELAVAAFGPGMHLVVSALVGLVLFGACTAGFIVIGDQMMPLLSNSKIPFFEDLSSNQRRAVLEGLVLLVFVLPLALQRQMTALRFTNLLGIVAVVFVAGVVVHNGVIGLRESNIFRHGGIDAVLNQPGFVFQPWRVSSSSSLSSSFAEKGSFYMEKLSNLFMNLQYSFESVPSTTVEKLTTPPWKGYSIWSFLRGLPIMLLAFNNQIQMLVIYHELRPRNLNSLRTVVGGSACIVTLIYLTVGLFGILAFPNVKKMWPLDEDILSSLENAAPHSSALVSAARVVMGCATTVILPMLLLPLRQCLIQVLTPLFIFLGRRYGNHTKENLSLVHGDEEECKENPDDEESFLDVSDQTDDDDIHWISESTGIHVGTTVSMMLGCYILGLAVPKLALVLSVTSSTACLAACLVLPCICLAKLMPCEAPNRKSSTSSSRHIAYANSARTASFIDIRDVTSTPAFSLRPPFLESDGTASLRGTIFNLVNTTIGAGLLALPYGFSKQGIVLASIFLFVVAVMGVQSTDLICRAMEISGAATYPSLGKVSWGNNGRSLVNITIVLLNFGLMCSYTCIIGDVLPPALRRYANVSDQDHSSFISKLLSREIVLPILAIVLLFPLSSVKKMAALRFTSYAAVAFAFIFCLVTVYLGFEAFFKSEVHFIWSEAVNGNDPNCPEVPSSSHDHTLQLFDMDLRSTVSALPLFFTAYVNQMNVPVLFTDLRRRGEKGGKSLNVPSKFKAKRSKLKFAAIVGTAFCTILFLAEAITGYMAFGRCVNANVLLEFSMTKPFYVLMKVLYSFVLSAVFPCMAYGCSKSIHGLIFGESIEPTYYQRCFESFLITFAATLVGVLVTEVGIIFKFVGCTTCALIMYVYPSLFYITVARRKIAEQILKNGDIEENQEYISVEEESGRDEAGNERCYRQMNNFEKKVNPWAWIVLSFGVVGGIGSTIVVLSEIF